MNGSTEILLGLQSGTQGQLDFYNDWDSEFPAFVSGFGGGKTYAGIQKMLRLGCTNHIATRKPHIYAAIEPDMPMVSKILLPTLFDDILDPIGLRYIDKSGAKLKPRVVIPDLQMTILLLGGNLPKKIVGFKCAGAYVDEAHLMPKLAWVNIINRLRDPIAPLMQIWATFTPEIPAWTHDVWGCLEIDGEPLPEGYAVYHSSSRANKYLPDGYIDRVLAAAEEGMDVAVVEGHFVTSSTGKVYHTYDPMVNRSEMAKYDPTLTLDLTFDFNPGVIGVTCLVCQRNGPYYFVVDEINVKGYSLEQTCGEILQRYGSLQQAPVRIFGDATGTRSTSEKTEYYTIKDILGKRGYTGKDTYMPPFRPTVSLETTTSNPSVADTCASVRVLLCNSTGYQALFINPRCKKLARDMRMVIYKSYQAEQNGKVHTGNWYDIYKGDGTVTHTSDALRYWVHKVAPKHNEFKRQTWRGMK